MSEVIQLHLFPISALIAVQSSDFSERRAWIAYKKQALHSYRLDCLGQSLALSLNPSDLTQTELGKPYLKHYPELAFNHSHSQLHYALAMSLHLQDIGVDVEDLSRKVRFEALAQHAFHVDEYQHWADTGFDPLFWFKVWTTKEALLKASGLGIRMSLNQLNTHCMPDQDRGICTNQLLGQFAYQHIQQGDALVTMAWRDVTTQWPIIDLAQLNLD